MKTPMQELIDWINDYQTEATTIYKSAVTAKAKELLKKEKKAIQQAFHEGMFCQRFDPNMGRAKMYYDETFNTKEK